MKTSIPKWPKNSILAVSYTHLDVYKRQTFRLPKTHGADFDSINRECQDLGNLFYFERRLELIEERLAESI